MNIYLLLDIKENFPSLPPCYAYREKVIRNNIVVVQSVTFSNSTDLISILKKCRKFSHNPHVTEFQMKCNKCQKDMSTCPCHRFSKQFFYIRKDRHGNPKVETELYYYGDGNANDIVYASYPDTPYLKPPYFYETRQKA